MSIIDRLRAFQEDVRRQGGTLVSPEGTRQPHVIVMSNHHGWGDNVAWFRPPKPRHDDSRVIGRIHGHLDRRPQEGDFIHCEMKSGKLGAFKVLPGGSYPWDPPDQFFVDVEFDHYVDRP